MRDASVNTMQGVWFSFALEYKPTVSQNFLKFVRDKFPLVFFSFASKRYIVHEDNALMFLVEAEAAGLVSAKESSSIYNYIKATLDSELADDDDYLVLGVVYGAPIEFCRASFQYWKYTCGTLTPGMVIRMEEALDRIEKGIPRLGKPPPCPRCNMTLPHGTMKASACSKCRDEIDREIIAKTETPVKFNDHLTKTRDTLAKLSMEDDEVPF